MIRAKGTDQRRRRGVVVVQLAVTSTVLLGFAALTVDIGRMYNARQELQRRAAALPGGVALGDHGTLDKGGAPVLPRDLDRAEAQSSIDDVSDQAEEVFGLLGCTTSVEVTE